MSPIRFRRSKPLAPHEVDVVIYLREHCHLCTQALGVVRSVVGDNFRTIDIDTPGVPAEIRTRYAQTIPVVCVNQVVVGELFISERQLRRAIGQKRRWWHI
ncbi:MAG: glutaredoxin family protein [Bowdeniella nasicola]|nr:glutaredoxin family protein [Bowdeniella nasicola]